MKSASSENHSIYPIVLQDTQIVEFLGRVAVRIADNRKIPSLVGHIFYPAHNFCKIGISIIADQHSNQIAALHAQTASERVRGIVELFGSLQDFFSGFDAHGIGGATQDAAGTSDGDPCTFRYLGDG